MIGAYPLRQDYLINNNIFSSFALIVGKEVQAINLDEALEDDSIILPVGSDLRLFTKEEYFDTEISDKDLEILGNFVKVAPKTCKNFRGLTLSKQIDLFKNIIDRYKEDPLIGISMLENYTIIDHNFDDEMETLLMELAIRKDIVEDKRDKVYHILGIETWHKKIVNDNNDFFQDF